jgi:hypothetical protein
VNLTLKTLAICGFFLAGWPISQTAYKAKPITRITGVILDQMGAAISGASLSLFSADKVRVAQAGTDGKFEFSDLPTGTYELKASSPGFRANTVEDIQLDASEHPPLSVALQIESNPCGDTRPTPAYEERSENISLVGYVSDFWEGSGPVSGAAVTVNFIRTGRAYAVTTGKRGDFQFVGLAPGKYTLKIAKAGYVKQSRIDFWIAAENLTKFKNIYIFKEAETRKIICE